MNSLNSNSVPYAGGIKGKERKSHHSLARACAKERDRKDREIADERQNEIDSRRLSI